MLKNGKIVEYTLVKGRDFDEFSNTVNLYLKDGWQLWGETKVIPNPGSTYLPIIYFQVMVKYD